MSGCCGFSFQRTRTCILVGAGASIHLGYPSFCNEDQVRDILQRALTRGDLFQTLEHQRNAKQLVGLLGPYFNWNLERIYEHLAHVPPFLYGQELDCNTDYLCQWLVTEVAAQLSAPRPAEALVPCKDRWLQLLRAKRLPAAFFTTNYDSILESVLAELGYADGWSRGRYRREHFDVEPKCDYALVKLHGSADWWTARQYNTLEVGRKPDKMDEALLRPACLPPFRRKWATQEPYASAYDLLAQALAAADELLVVGFSWRDVSAATVLRAAMGARACRSPLSVHVFDKEPYGVEERVRLFLHGSGGSHLVPTLDWRHDIGPFPDIALTQEGYVRTPLDREISLLDREAWVALSGEPKMLHADYGGCVSVGWESSVRYFESGRLVLLPVLPNEFEVELRMVVKHYGSGWDPGVSLEDRRGDEVVSARFVPGSTGSHPHWRRAADGEPDVSGLRVARTLEYVRRNPVREGVPVTVRIAGWPNKTCLAAEADGQHFPPFVATHPADRRPTRLSLGGYPWYSDDGSFGRSAECVMGPCIIRPA